jgi:hypothetical protein
MIGERTVRGGPRKIASRLLAAERLITFHSLTVHSARANNRPDLRRRAYAVRMTGRDVRYYGGKVWNEFIMNPALKTGDPLDSDQYPVLYGPRR